LAERTHCDQARPQPARRTVEKAILPVPVSKIGSRPRTFARLISPIGWYQAPASTFTATNFRVDYPLNDALN
jgi:hypothetical protein